ncbi:MAG TPA: DUF362 domain-containing protein [Methanosarcinaceae archaeon]|nr:DUF362 domain-containing protein [Methanosarcinaceae archaeon]
MIQTHELLRYRNINSPKTILSILVKHTPMSKVSLHSTTDPHDITKILRDIHAENCFDTNETILIKPNYVTDDLPSTGITVDPAIVAGIVAYLQDHGFKNVIVGEGGMTNYDMPSVFEKVGLTDALRPYGITPVDLNSDEMVEVVINSATALKKVTVARTYLEVDAIISISKLKVHSLADVTLCMKNMMGGLNPKNIMHNRIHEKIVDLNRRFVPRLSIIDGIVGNLCHETVCSPVEFNVIAGGTDVVAVDSVGAYLLGYEPSNVEYLVRAKDAGLGECKLGNITVVGDDPVYCFSETVV